MAGNKKNNNKKWTEEDLQNAIHELNSIPGSSIRGVSKKYGFDESTLRFRLKKIKANEELKVAGRKNVFDVETEAELAKCIAVVCNLGFSPTIAEIIEIVHQYIVTNSLEAKQFKNMRPGLTWIKNFMKRNKLSHKKAELISCARKANTSNPFIIYDFYDQLREIFKKHTELDASRIWNCDESGFPTDPNKGKVISVKGKRALKLRYGAGRENITVLGVCSAAGVVLDPLIIFKGRNMQSSWFGDNALPNTYYGKSENGWMETETFAAWFEYFANFVTERPLLLLFDGHLTHISIPVIKRALDENIIIMKFPPHVTDVMQPLDVSCFGPLKRAWDARLMKRVNEYGIKRPLTRCEFVNELCGVWKNGMKKENAISGFETTGIYPVNSEMYPKNRLDPRLLTKYETWRKSGEPLNWEKLMDGNDEDETNFPETNRPDLAVNEPELASVIVPVNQSTLLAPTTPPPLAQPDLISIIGPYPFVAPTGYKWIPKWELQPEEKSQTTNQPPLNTPIANRSFSELFLDKVKPPEKKKAMKNRRLDIRAQIVSNREMLDAMERKEKEKDLKERQKEENRKKREEKKQEKESKKRKEMESDTSENEEDINSEGSEEVENEDIDEEENEDADEEVEEDLED